MPHGPFFERDIASLRRLQDDAFKGVQAAEAVLFDHSKPEARLTAINFPLEESLLGEAVGLLVDWKTQAAALLRKLDAETASANLQFERLFDENAGRQSQGYLRRRVHLGHAEPETIAVALVDLLSISAALDRMLNEARPLLVLHHRGCEAYLLRLVARRRQWDVDLVDAERRLASLTARTHGRQSSMTSPRSPASEAASEEERRMLALDRHAAQVRDEVLRSERETLLRLIADDEDFLDVLNSGIAAVNVMAAKLALDVEQRIALLKAVNAQSAKPLVAFPAPVEATIVAFDANILSGHDLLMRKQRTDDAFSRRLEAALPMPGAAADEDGAAPTPPPPLPPSI